MPYSSHTREPKDTAQDTLLLLFLLQQGGDKICGKNSFDAKIKLMKLVFLAEMEMVSKRLKGFNFFYNIYKHGPSSMELLQLVDDLEARKFINYDSENVIYSLTPKAKRVVSDFKAEVGPSSKEFFEVISKIIEENASLSTQDLLKKVYEMKFIPNGEKEITIGEGVKRELRNRLLMKLDKPEKELNMPNEWVVTLNMLMNNEFVGLV